MKKTVKFVALVLALALVSMLFAACGQKSAVEQIKKNGKITMLTNAAWAPFEYLGANGAVEGVDVDIAQAIADELGVTLEVVDMDFDGIVAAIQSGKGDLGVAGMSITEERLKSVDFSTNYVSTTQVIIVQEGSTIASAADLSGKTVGVQLGTTGDIFATAYAEGAEIQRLKTGADAGMALANGQLDAVVIDAIPAQQIVSANAGLTIVDEPLTEEEYAIAIAKESDLLPVVNSVLEKLLADGSIDAMMEKHTAASAG